ncbi:hypothetical protein TNCV_119691 [Trichonephila clavipes]|nr:hypothetical protein TNCV_119691 [Trichonephila clavipes]
MRVRKQWNDESRTTRKSAYGPIKVTSIHEGERLFTSSSNQCLIHHGLHARILFCALPHSRKPIQTCGYSGHMDLGTGVLIGSK